MPEHGCGTRPLPRATLADVAVVVLNYDGREHLATCLESLLSIEGLSSPEAILVADNGSTDGSLELLARRYPGVRSLAHGRNLGFAAGNNLAAEALASEYVLFLNNDTRIDSEALRHLCEAVGGEVACAGARLLNWDGRRLDFDGGGASFTGHGHSLGFGRCVPRRERARSATLFCSGAAMLIHRRTFLELGGFDPDYFFYYEDVELGWRLWVAGYACLHVPAAIVHHRHHGTAHRLHSPTAARLYERNALATVVKVYGEDLLPRVLPASLALAAHRAGADLEVIASAEPRPGPELPIPGPSWAGWQALAPLELDFEALLERRKGLQACRRRPDSEVLPLLVMPLAPVPAEPRAWRALGMAVKRFELEPVFGSLGTGAGAQAGGPFAVGGRALRRLKEDGVSGLTRALQEWWAWRSGTRRWPPADDDQ